jgi:excisionase family DNA binding protein
MTSELVAVPLPDGRWLALTPEALREALVAGGQLGLGKAGAAPSAATVAPADEPLMNSEELGAVLGLHSTTVEGMAARGEIPSIRIGRALRFEPAAVKEALRAAKTKG